MQRQSFILLVLLLGVTTLAGLTEEVWGQTPLEPVQSVAPDSTYEDIQQMLDNGGTVYFEYGQYNQLVGRPGFHLGRLGEDVHVIGLLGPNGERPKIEGGYAAFRVGKNPFIGVTQGQPVSFRIENLEIDNPEVIASSRIGIWVTALGAETVIDNCKITIRGDVGDSGHENNHSVGIWFWLVDFAFFGNPRPPSGATIDVTNNTIVASRIHEGIHVDSFWSLEDGFVPPRPFIGNNLVNVSRLGGFQNGAGTNGATLATAILVEGNLRNPVVTNNVIEGDGRSPGADPPVESVAIGLVSIGRPGEALDHVMVVGNDSSRFKSDFQMWIEPLAGSSTVGRNAFGPAGRAGVRSGGHDGSFVNNHFYGKYPGWTSSGGGRGLFWFTEESHGNVVEATKLNKPPHGFDICRQVLDETEGDNVIRGSRRCQAR